MTYISPRGLEELMVLSVTQRNLVPHGKPPAQVVSAMSSEECGCPEEIWVIDELVYLIHFEPDGTGEVTSFHDEYGDGVQYQRDAKTINELRAEMFKIHDEILRLPETES